MVGSPLTLTGWGRLRRSVVRPQPGLADRMTTAESAEIAEETLRPVIGHQSLVMSKGYRLHRPAGSLDRATNDY